MRLAPPWRARAGRCTTPGALATAILLAACSADPSSPAPDPPSVSVTVASADSLYFGESAVVVAQFPAAADSAPGHVREVTWTSSDTAVAVVTGRDGANGTASATVFSRAAGAAVVTVRVRTNAGGVAEASTVVRVRGAYRLGLWPDTNALVPGLARTLVARDLKPDAPGAPLPGAAWSSDAPGVAAVDGLGRVVAVGAGRATITATLGGRQASALVVVRDYGGPLAFADLVAGVGAGADGAGVPHTCGLADGGRAFCWGATSARCSAARP